MLYQVCQTGKLVRGENGATTGTPVWKVIMIVIDVVLALLAVLAIVLNIILPIVKKRRVNA